LQATLTDLSTEEKKNVLLLAAAKGVLDVLQIPEFKSILLHQDSVDSLKRSVLHYASYHGHFDIIKYLLDDLQINYKDFTVSYLCST
jgi:ankyrin repeat protein